MSAQPLAHRRQELGEGPHVGTGSGMQAVGQGQLRGLIDDKGEAELSEIMTALFVVAALGELRLEVGGVRGESLNLERFAAHDLADRILFDEGEGGSGEVHEIGEVGGFGPIGEGANADRGEGKGEGVAILMEFDEVFDAAEMGENKSPLKAKNGTLDVTKRAKPK